MVPAVRHAIALNPTSKYFFHLSSHALIMNPTQSLKAHLLDRNRLESIMLKDVPIVPPDSIIRTFSHQKEKDVDLILTQDAEDLNPGSFILKNGDFARYFLDLWFDPLFRTYNFAKAETHGLVCVFEMLCWLRSSLADLFTRIISCNGTRLSSPGLP
jgi:mannan polymerase II complex MNN11 subunit